MADGVQRDTGSLVPALQVAQTLVSRSSANGIRFAFFGDLFGDARGEMRLGEDELRRILQAVPALVTPALMDRVFYFVPLAIPELAEERGTFAGDARPLPPESSPTLIAAEVTPELLEDAICHRNVSLPARGEDPAHEGVFISARLLRDQFALAFELFINVGHAFAENAGIPEEFAALVWSQALADVRGETSQDAWEARAAALQPRVQAGPARLGHGGRQGGVKFQAKPEPRVIDEKARVDFVESAFADALAIYQLSLAVDFDYAELREREYPLLAPAGLAERLRLVARLFPPNAGYEFAIRYRRRG